MTEDRVGRAIVWIALFVLWFILGLPLGPGYPVQAVN